MKLNDLVLELEELLRNKETEDYKNAFNGLQIENTGKVEKIAVAADGCEASILAAVAGGFDLLIVHHGLFWNGAAPLTGPYFRKVRAAMEGNLAVYSSHLPLDLHPTVGNNALFADMLKFPTDRLPFLDVGLQVEVNLDRDELQAAIGEVVGGRVHLAPGGPASCRRVGVCTGGAGGEIFKAAAAGVDTFITGEGPHWSYTAAEELGINLFYAGHYATETFGVKALGAHLEAKFGLPWQFLDHPTGL